MPKTPAFVHQEYHKLKFTREIPNSVKLFERTPSSKLFWRKSTERTSNQTCFLVWWGEVGMVQAFGLQYISQVKNSPHFVPEQWPKKTGCLLYTGEGFFRGSPVNEFVVQFWRPLECIVEAGDVVYVPWTLWWSMIGLFLRWATR